MKLLVTALILSLAFTVCFLNPATSQEPSTCSIFWKIEGKNLSTPSYLFGTFHLLNGNYLNKMEKWKNKFKTSKTLIVEMVLDSSKLMEVTASMVSPDTTLDKLLSKAEYEKASKYFKEVSGMELTPYNSLKPISLSVLLTTYTWAKLKPEDYIASDLPMDLYFVKKAREDVKTVVPLETMEQQVEILYEGMTLRRQKEFLMDLLNDIEQTRENILKMDECYREEDLECLNTLIYGTGSYNEVELDAMLKERNIKWLNTILPSIDDESTFIAVGAGHLPGETGLINLLRKEGYTVSPVEF